VGADDSTVLVSGDSNRQIFNGHEAYSHEDQRDKESAIQTVAEQHFIKISFF
jgi:hypothetical protein